MATTTKKVPYDPRAYVPGGSQPQVAKAIQALGFANGTKVANPVYVTRVVPKTSTAQSSGSGNSIETLDQVEARVTRLANAAYDRQKADLEAEVARMKKEAEGRRVTLQSAYEAAAKANAALGLSAQQGWNTAADTLKGLSQQMTGGIASGLEADMATQEAALARVGAGGTGFDARSQAAVEDYRGGFLDSEYFTRQGGINTEGMAKAAQSLNLRGVQEGTAEEMEALHTIDADRLKQIATLGENRLTYEADLRKQLMSARGDQLDAIEAANKRVEEIRQFNAKLKRDYYVARSRATTAKEKLLADTLYKNAQAEQKRLLDAALIAQRNASAGLTTAKTNDILNGAGFDGAGNPVVPDKDKPTGKAATARDDAIEAQNDWVETRMSKTKKVRDVQNADTGVWSYKEVPVPLPYAEAYRHVFGQLKLKLKRFGYSDADIRVATNDLLRTYGIVPPKAKKPVYTPPGLQGDSPDYRG